MGKLHMLNLSCCSLTDEVLDLLQNQTDLKELDLSHNQHITQAGFGVFTEMQELEYLNLKNCDLTDSDLLTLQHLTSLKKLNLSDNTRLNDEAIVMSGKSRLRPVLMTSLTTILGMLPLAMSKGDGSEIWSPMGIAVIGGLIFSTIVTLILIPVIYQMVLRRSEKRKKAVEYDFMNGNGEELTQ